MGSFLKKNKKFHLLIKDHTIKGRFGFSFTEESLRSFLYSFYNFIMNYGYNRLCLGQDGTGQVNILFKDIIVPTLSTLGIKSHISEDPIVLPQFVWFCQESKQKSIGLYFSSINLEENIEIEIYENGEPISNNSFKKLVSSTDTISINTLEGYETEDPEFFNLEGYCKWLLNNKHITPVLSSLSIDTMFGASLFIGKNLKKQLNLDLNLYNLQTDSPRFKNYISKPTGQFLKWMTTHPSVKKEQFFFGLNASGSSLGLYDLKQNLEISSAGVALLLLKYLKEIKKISNACILLSTGLNSRVSTYVKKLGYKHKITNLGLNSIKKELEKKRHINLYADENGNFYFGDEKIICSNPFIAIFQIIELCKLLNKSPGEVLDEIYDREIPKLIYHNNFFLFKDSIDQKDLICFLENEPNIKSKSLKVPYFVIKFKDHAKLVIKDNTKENILEIFIESPSPDRAKELGNRIESFLKQQVNSVDKLPT